MRTSLSTAALLASTVVAIGPGGRGGNGRGGNDDNWAGIWGSLPDCLEPCTTSISIAWPPAVTALCSSASSCLAAASSCAPSVSSSASSTLSSWCSVASASSWSWPSAGASGQGPFWPKATGTGGSWSPGFGPKPTGDVVGPFGGSGKNWTTLTNAPWRTGGGPFNGGWGPFPRPTGTAVNGSAPWTSWWCQPNGNNNCPFSDWPGWTAGNWSTAAPWTRWANCTATSSLSVVTTTNTAGSVQVYTTAVLQVAEASAVAAVSGSVTGSATAGATAASASASAASTGAAAAIRSANGEVVGVGAVIVGFLGVVGML